MREPAAVFGRAHAERIAAEFTTTGAVHRWPLPAFAIMANHVHVVVGVPSPGDTSAAADATRRFKAYASRALNEGFGRRTRWWTSSGSRRLLVGEPAVIAAVRHVANQRGSLVVRLDPEWRSVAQIE
jgi:REP element-mobilizing transposase RayT